MKKPLVYILALAATTPLARADTINVTSLAGDTSSGTLYDAVNTLAGLGPGPHFIDMFSLTGTIELEQDLPAIDFEVGIRGTSADKITISGKDTRRIFEVAAGGDLELHQLTLRGGNGGTGGGGAVLNHGELLLLRCVVTSNTAGCGGAIRTLGTSLKLEKCLFVANRTNGTGVGDGGAIECTSGTTRIDDCTFTNNFANNRGGAVAIFGGVSSFEMGHCTVVDNSTTGGFGSGGGVFSGISGAIVGNCIVAQNIVNAVFPDDVGGPFTSRGNNLIGGDPKLRPLSGYGDPVPYRLPHLDSPAIDAADDNIFAFAKDARDVSRPNSGSDIGAVEVRTLRLLSSDGGIGAIAGIHDIVGMLNGAAEPYDYVDMRGQPGSIQLTQKLPALTRRGILVGSHPQLNEIRGGAGIRIFEIAAGANITLENLTLKSCDVTGNPAGDQEGGAILNSGFLIITRCQLDDNKARCGGAIRSRTSTASLFLEQSSFIGNTATLDSGAVELLGSFAEIGNCTFGFNEAGRHGGALGAFLGQTIFDVIHCTFCGNKSGTDGDAVYSAANPGSVRSSIVSDCNQPNPNDDLVQASGTLGSLDNFTGADPQLLIPVVRDPTHYTTAYTPLPGSPVLNVLKNTIGDVDQNGFARLADGFADLGAAEAIGHPYRRFVARHFDAYDLCSAEKAYTHWRPQADGDRDGVPAWKEAVFGMNPLVPDRHLLPRHELVNRSGSVYPAIVMTDGWLGEATRLSNDLKTWTDVGIARESVGATVPGVTSLTVRSATPIPTAGDEFLRLEAVVPVPLVQIIYVGVGEPGNANDTGGSATGQVNYHYAIGKYEVTNHEYVTFLNAVDPTGANALGLFVPAMATSPHGGVNRDTTRPAGDRYVVRTGRHLYPVNFVTFYSAARFCNWLSNGGTPGAGTETGTYTLLGGTPTPSNADTITRNAGAVVALPTLQEWYKAAYYNADTDSYANFPTGAATSNNFPPPGNAGSANYGSTQLEPVGSYFSTNNYYRTRDMGGNVRELTESPLAGNPAVVYGPGTGFDGSTNDMSAPFAEVVGIARTAPIASAGFRVVELR